MKKFLLILILLFIFVTPAYANETKNQILDNLEPDISEFEKSLPDEIKKYFPDGLVQSSNPDEINILNEKNFIEVILNYLTAGLSDVVKIFVSLLSIIMIASIFNIMKSSAESEGLKNTFSIVSSLCVSLTVFNVIFSLAKTSTQYVKTICDVMTSFIPIMTTLYIMGGNISSATVSATSTLLFISLTENFLVLAVMPIIKVCLCFALVKSINGSCDLSGLSKIIKNTFISVTVFTMSVFTFIFSCKNVISKSADSLSIKTAKFAVGSFIPIVGSSINESMSTITASLSIIKNSCGTVALVCIALIILPAIISLLLYKLSFGLCSAFSNILGCESESKILDEASSICNFILSVVCCSSLLFILSLTVFINTNLSV